MAKKEDKGLFTIPEISAMLPGKGEGGKSHPSRVYRWIDPGFGGIKLPTVIVGSRKMVRSKDLREFLRKISDDQYANSKGLDVLLKKIEKEGREYKSDWEEKSLAAAQGGGIVKGRSISSDGSGGSGGVDSRKTKRWVGYCIPLKRPKYDYQTSHVTREECISLCNESNKKRKKKGKLLLAGIRWLYWPYRALVKSATVRTDYPLDGACEESEDVESSVPASASLDFKVRDTLINLTELVSNSLGKMERQIRSVEKLTLKIDHLTNLGGSLLSAVDRCAAGMNSFNSSLPIQVVAAGDSGNEDQKILEGESAKKMLEMLRANPEGLTKSAIKSKLSGVCTKELTGTIMRVLIENGLALTMSERERGRDVERWFAVDPENEEDLDE